MRNILVPLALLACVAVRGFANDYTVALVPKSAAQEYWKAIHAGAVKAGRELESTGVRVNLLWKAPAREHDRAAQILEVEAAVGASVSGIVLAPVDAKALVKPVEAAIDAQIPVVIIDSGLESNAIVSFVGTNNYESGKHAAIHLGDLLGGRGNVAMLRYLEHCGGTEARELGFLDGLKSHYPEIKIVSSDQHSGITRELACAAAGALVKRFGEKLQGVFTSAGTATFGMNEALKEAGLSAGKIKHVGFDAGTECVSALREGNIQGLIVQDPFQIGYLGVKALVQHLIKKDRVEKKIDAPTYLVTPENVDDAKSKELIHPPLD